MMARPDASGGRPRVVRIPNPDTLPMPNLPGFGVEPRPGPQFARLTERLLEYCAMALEGLTVEDINDTRGGLTNSLGFDVWHVARTADNLVHFVFEREQPAWVTGGFFERWGLPRVDQGTGMDPSVAYSLTFPAAITFCEYVEAVSRAIVPRIASMSDAYLATVQFIRPWGDVPRIEAIGHGLIGHGNGHLGRASYVRTLLGKPGLPY